MTLSGHFISSSKGRIFLTVTGTLGPGAAILCLPPLFEEMNLSRAVIAKQAQFFAANGLPTCVMDYYGTGDSEGGVDEANASDWLNDVIASGAWLEQQGVTEIILWGVRFGGLLLLHFQGPIHEHLPVHQQLVWKPVTDGKLYGNQVLRVKRSNALLRGIDDKVDWRQRIAEGGTVEVAGYSLNECLLSSIESLTATSTKQPQTRLAWMELGAHTMTPAVERIVSAWDNNLYQFTMMDSPLFWHTPETFTVPALYPHSLALLEH
jgi:exosortase A-associated hydrolase 2